MRRELSYFSVGGGLGGNQDRLRDPMMRAGGCAAVCACDSCLYFTLYRGAGGLYPGDAGSVTEKDYLAFSSVMKPYLRPRARGIDAPEIYIDGLGAYLRDRGAGGVKMDALPGTETAGAAWRALRGEIDAGLPAPCLILSHADRAFGDYEWHWFMLTGYDGGDGPGLVKAVTYGSARWLPFAPLWNTGKPRRGGLVLYGGV